jgi:CheY-like chemotaxis protein
MNKTLLIVEDHATTREALAVVCRAEGFRVLTAASSREALDQLRSQSPPDVMVLDLRVTGGDGGDLLEERRRDTALASVPLVLLTERQADQRWRTEPGLAGSCPKPVPLEGLLHLLRRCG